MKTPVIGFAGLTHLGMCSALAAAAKGFKVIGFDPDRERSDALNAGALPIHEPGAQDLLDAHRERLEFTADAARLDSCDVVFIARDVPTDDRGISELSGVTELISIAAGDLRADATLVVLCQVPPGFIRRQALAGPRLFYQVETLIFGRAIERATSPERIIVGRLSDDTDLPTAYRAYLDAFACPILPMRYESAELAKIAINCCLVASVTIANTLAGLCEGIGADWSEIAPALKLDRRIGPYSYLAPGLGIAGGNLERDLATVKTIAAEVGAEVSVIDAYLANSRHRRDWVLRQFHAALPEIGPDPQIAILGLAYKENTHSTKNSPALALIEALSGFRLRAFDPVVKLESVATADSALAALTGADIALVMTPWPEFKDLTPERIAGAMRQKRVVDPFAVLDEAGLLKAGFRYSRLGRPNDA